MTLRQEYIRSRKTEDLLAEAASTQHQYTHFPQEPILQNLPKSKNDGSSGKEERWSEEN